MKTKWVIGIVVLLWLLASATFVAAAGDCDGTPGNDVIICATNPTNPDDQADGDLGDDIIVINAGVTISDLDADGESATDVRGAGNGGNDTITNNGTITGTIEGDWATGNGGNDFITNNSLVMGNINGDGVFGAGGNDTIINKGTVLGIIDGQDGNDKISLRNGANGGVDNTLLIDGNTGTDQLDFSLTISNPAEQAALDAVIVTNPAAGSITLNGQTFQWTGMELLTKNSSGFGGGGTPGSTANNTSYSFQDKRLNNWDLAATAAVYCADDSDGVVIYGINDDSRGYLLFAISWVKLDAALQKAVAQNQHVEIVEADGQSLWALKSNELQLHDSGGRYDFIFASDRCVPPIA